MTNQDPHVNDYKDGLNKDFNPESFPKTAYEDANNLRLFTSEDGQSLGAIQNVTGTRVAASIPQSIVGMCQLRDKVVVFATDDSSEEGGEGFIYEVEFNFQDFGNDADVNLIYSNPDLRFSRLRPIEAIGIFENANFQRVYFSDFENPTRSINIADPLVSTFAVSALNFFPNPGVVRPVVDNVSGGGSLRAGIYSYCYFFTSEGGNTTVISPMSQQVHIVQADDNNASTTNNYFGITEIIDDDFATTKQVTLTVDLSELPPDTYQTISLVSVFLADFGELPQIAVVESEDISGNTDSVILVHSGNEGEEIVSSFEEFATGNVPFKTNKTFGIKDNILFCANIKGYEIDVPDVIREGLETFRFRQNSSNTYDNYGVYQNPFNDESGTVFGEEAGGTYETWLDDYQYKFQQNSGVLGGSAEFISYEFCLHRMEGDSSPNIGLGFLTNFFNDNQAIDDIDIDDGVDYLNRSFRDFASPYNRVVRGYKRGEVYRFGIVFFNSAGGSSSVQFIGDIKFPEISDTSSSPVGTTYGGQPIFHFPISLSRGYDGDNAGYTDLFSLGINFTVSLDQDFLAANEITHYQIVRCKRKDSDKSRLAQGVVNKWYLPATAFADADVQDNPQVFYPVAEMLDIPGHLNRYHKNSGRFEHEGEGIGGNEAPTAFGENAEQFIYPLGGINSAAFGDGIHGDDGVKQPHVHDVQDGTGYDFHNSVFNTLLPSNDRRTGVGYIGGSVLGEDPDSSPTQSDRRNIIETSVPYQSAASVECLMSFHCPEITFNHFVPSLSSGVDFLRTVGVLTYTTKHNTERKHHPFGIGPEGSELEYQYPPSLTRGGKLDNFTQWGHTLYSIQNSPGNTQNSISNSPGSMERGTDGGSETSITEKRKEFRPLLGCDNMLGADSDHEKTFFYRKKDPARSDRKLITKARQTSPLDVLGNAPADFHLQPENFEKIEDMQSIVPSTYVFDPTITVGDFTCKNLAFEMGNVFVDGMEHTRMARHGTNLLISTGTIAGAKFHSTNSATHDNAGRFIANHPGFAATAGTRGENFAGSAFLVEYVRRNTNQYGGQSQTAVAANTFFTTSAPIKVTEINATTGQETITASQNFKVFEGDTFVQYYEFMKNFWNNQYSKNDETSQNASAFNYNDSSTFETVVIPVESVINTQLNAGASRFAPNEGLFDPGEDVPENYRMQEQFDVNGVSNVLFNGTTKAFEYNPVFSEDQITKIFFADPPDFNPVSEFDVRTYYSNTKILGESVDAFTQFGILNYKDIDPAYGAINRLLNLQDEIVTIQDDAIGVFLVNTRELAGAESGTLITLGTGDGVQDFSYVTTQNGSIHQYAAVVADGVAYILDAKRKALVILKGTTAQDVSKALGMNSYFNDNIGGMMLLTKKQGGDNPLIGIGATLGYDTRNREVLISLFGNQYGYNLNNNYSYGPNKAFNSGFGTGLGLDGNIELLYMNGVPFDVTNLPVQAGGNPGIINVDGDAINTPGDELSAYGEILESDITPLLPLPDFNSNLFDVLQSIDGNFESILPSSRIEGSTLVYSEPMAKFTSFYSCLPSQYLNGFRELMSVPTILGEGSVVNTTNRLFVHNEGDYGRFYGEVSDTSLTFIVNTGALLNKILRFIEYNCTVKDENGNVIQSAGLNRIRVENDYQDSSEVEIDQVHRFRKFRIKLPRDEEGGRFRGTFFKVSLFFDNSVNLSLTLQRIMSFFDIQTY